MEERLNNFDLYGYITAQCLKYYSESPSKPPLEMAEALMEHPDFLMHCPEHHYLVPAVLLTAACRMQGRPADDLAKLLEETQTRSKNVLGAFCGLYGACGAAIGIGIYASVLTNTTPYSVETWSAVNLGTAESLLEMAKINGPRCCKRNTYLALQYASSFSREHLGIDLADCGAIQCTHSARNKECKRGQCPFYQQSV
ncbi:hypothetical protein UNSWDHB_2991 [Dehalobacter sp. UNSWDHB]|uniref:DUF5714 domain-containing protein n=1 Tax=unclassified Dehalobacter TaxID=2635733 RepID=UPI0003879A7E|nr:DUF5714 domain-containing protein [Dehalobacter sp. UNSWDHB]EQB22677.1 hypothetical protein UNSWDHB_2991 [Dehalobacter sp. UNSWDHB]UWG97596.1 DUF5714 domain-containing protein [Dehalobacter sp. DCM]